MNTTEDHDVCHWKSKSWLGTDNYLRIYPCTLEFIPPIRAPVYPEAYQSTVQKCLRVVQSKYQQVSRLENNTCVWVDFFCSFRNVSITFLTFSTKYYISSENLDAFWQSVGKYLWQHSKPAFFNLDFIWFNVFILLVLSRG